MKKVSRFIATLVFVILTLPVFSVAFATPRVPVATSNFYVNDFAGVFSEEETTILMEKAVELSNTSDGIQVVITTVKSLDGNTVEDYAYAMYNQYGIGKNDMGVLILLSTGDRKIRVEIGQNMEAYITDSKAGRLLDSYAIPKLRDNKFNEGLIDLQTAVINEIKNSVTVPKANETPAATVVPQSTEEQDSSEEPAEMQNSKETKKSSGIWSGFIAIVCAVISGLSMRRSSQKNKENSDLIEALNRAESSRNSAVEESESVKEKARDIAMQKKELERQYDELAKQYNALRERYERAKTLFPNLDAGIDAMIEEEIRKKDMAKATTVDSIVQQVESLSASEEALHEFEHALYAYDALSQVQQSYVRADISKVRSLHEKSKKLRQQRLAKDATEKISSLIAGIVVGRESNIRNLSQASSLYEELDYGSQKYVDSSIPEKVSRLMTQAKQDKAERERREEEERRRKRQQEEAARRRHQQQMSSYHSSRSSSSFRGFGGRSGGGGASRGF